MPLHPYFVEINPLNYKICKKKKYDFIKNVRLFKTYLHKSFRFFSFFNMLTRFIFYGIFDMLSIRKKISQRFSKI